MKIMEKNHSENNGKKTIQKIMAKSHSAGMNGNKPLFSECFFSIIF